jgi:hypothetical protein
MSFIFEGRAIGGYPPAGGRSSNLPAGDTSNLGGELRWVLKLN